MGGANRRYNANVTAELHGFTAPTTEAAREFGRILIESGLYARVRIERGSDIAAACGQLALTSTTTPKNKTKTATGRDAGAADLRDIEDIGASMTYGCVSI